MWEIIKELYNERRRISEQRAIDQEQKINGEEKKHAQKQKCQDYDNWNHDRALARFGDWKRRSSSEKAKTNKKEIKQWQDQLRFDSRGLSGLLWRLTLPEMSITPHNFSLLPTHSQNHTSKICIDKHQSVQRSKSAATTNTWIEQGCPKAFCQSTLSNERPSGCSSN